MVELTATHRRCLPSGRITSHQRKLRGVLLDSHAQRTIIRRRYRIDSAVYDIECRLPFEQTYLEIHLSIIAVIISSTPFNIKYAVRRDSTDGRKDAIGSANVADAAREGAEIGPVREDRVGGSRLRHTGCIEGIVHSPKRQVPIRSHVNIVKVGVVQLVSERQGDQG